MRKTGIGNIVPLAIKKAVWQGAEQKNTKIAIGAGTLGILVLLYFLFKF